MKTDSTDGSGVKVSGPVDELNPKALNEAGEQIAKGTGKGERQLRYIPVKVPAF